MPPEKEIIVDEKEVATIESKLDGKTVSEKADIKAEEIAKLDVVGEHIDDTKQEEIKVEILSIEKIEGGVQVFARAWKDGVQLGFGADGSIDIERFRFINPPVMVYDPAGDVVRESVKYDIKTKQEIIVEKRLREDPMQALLDTLNHTIRVVGKTGTKIEEGKVGNTTTTLFPAAGANAPVDGAVFHQGAVFLTVQAAVTGTSVVVTGATDVPLCTNYLDTGTYYIRRGFFGFDMTSVGTDVVSSVVFSVTGDGGAPENANSSTINIVSASPASTNNLVAGDFDAVGSTIYASKAYSSWTSTDGVYNDFTLDANGIAYVDGNSGIFFLSTRDAQEMSLTAPTGGNEVQTHNADQTGTSSDPKLVVVHAPASAGTRSPSGGVAYSAGVQMY